MPAILLMCMVGSYAVGNDLFDVGVMLIMGMVGFILETNGFPVAPIILGLVLGPIIEQNFMISLIKSQGNLLLFFGRPMAALLGAMTVAVWLMTLLPWIRRKVLARIPVSAEQ
jgi:TctA family transporter